MADIYFGNLTASDITLGNFPVEEVWFGNNIIWSRGAPKTYVLSNTALHYSTGSTLQPNQSNYAYIDGTLKTYQGGVLIKTETVVCNPVYEDNYIYTENKTILWDKAHYGATTVNYHTTSVYGTIHGVRDGSRTFNLTVGSNTSGHLGGASIDEVKVGSFTLPHTFPYAAATYDMEITGTRFFYWSSGEYNRSEQIRAYNTNVNAYAEIGDIQFTQGVEAYYVITNNGNEPITVTAYVEDTYTYTPPDLPYDYNTDYVYETYTIEPHTTFTTRSLHADGSIDIPYPGNHTHSTYIVVNSETFHFPQSRQGSSISINKAIGYNPYFSIRSSSSWHTVSGMQMTLTSNNTGYGRIGTITVNDTAYGAASVDFSLTQDYFRPEDYAYRINSDLCTQCGTCLEAGCPVDAIYQGSGGYHIDPDACIGCGQCMYVCPAGAIIPPNNG